MIFNLFELTSNSSYQSAKFRMPGKFHCVTFVWHVEVLDWQYSDFREIHPCLLLHHHNHQGPSHHSLSDVENNRQPPPFTMLNDKLLPLPCVGFNISQPDPPLTFRCILHPSLPILCQSCLLSCHCQQHLPKHHYFKCVFACSLAHPCSSLSSKLYLAAHYHCKPAGAYWTWKSVIHTSRRCESLQSSSKNIDNC